MSVERYVLGRTLGAGGMAQVVEAVAHGSQGFRRRVAIKRILPERASDESMRRMFLDEARIASHLDHANIVQVLDFGVLDDAEFLVMELVDGVDASSAAARGRERARPMPEGVALHVVAEVAHALAHAHDRRDDDGRPLGIVHRDVNPQNVLLSWAGGVKLSDFGIALAATRSERTATGGVKGKLSFMAPEQAQGHRVTAAADVCALGLTLHALLCGRVPVDGIAGLAAWAAGRAPEPSEELSSEARALVSACLAVDPTDRPTAAEVARRAGELASARLRRDGRGALAEWLAEVRPPARAPSALDRMQGLWIVPGAEERSYTVVPADPTSAALEETVEESTAQTVPARPVDVASSAEPALEPAAGEPATAPEGTVGQRGLRYAAAAGLLLVAVGLGFYAVMAEPGPGSAPEPRPAVPTVAPEAREAEGDDPAARTPTRTEALSVAPPDPPPEPQPAPGSREPASGERRVRATPAVVGGMESRPAMEPTDAPAMEDPPAEPAMEAPPAERGWLFVGGERLLDCRVTVDGVALSGRAPGRWPLAAGPHSVAVVHPGSGETIARRAVDIRADSTHGAPLRIAEAGEPACRP